MKLLAKELCGKHIGREILYIARDHGTWNKATGQWEGGFNYQTQGPILMITHKKSGYVNVRIGGNGGDRSYSPDFEIELA